MSVNLLAVEVVDSMSFCIPLRRQDMERCAQSRMTGVPLPNSVSLPKLDRGRS